MDKEGKDMTSALKDRFPALKIDHSKHLQSYVIPKTKDGKVILDRSNSTHRQWLEDNEK
jgi:hypothetical protein